MSSIFENDFVRNFCEQAGIKFEKPEPKSKEFTFADFKKHMNKLVMSLEFDDKLNEFVREYWRSNVCDVELAFPNQIDNVIALLEYIMHDEDDWIGYWLFELDCGKRHKPGVVTNPDGSDIPLATLEDLWNLLTKENKNEN